MLGRDPLPVARLGQLIGLLHLLPMTLLFQLVLSSPPLDARIEIGPLG